MTTKAIVQHFDDFLDYCESEGLKNATQINYQRYLKKFTEWLRFKRLEGLLPHQLSINHINDYKLHLSIPHNHKNERILKKSTQNYYLIALRALLSYFMAKDIVSLLPDKVTLPRPHNESKNREYPTNDQLVSLLEKNSEKTQISLRNKAILQTIISTGFKINQINSLNRDSIEELPEAILPYIKEYLETRTDGEEALFINYSGIKNASRRLTPRMIQRIIKEYGNQIGFTTSFTPEKLRFANILAVWNKEIEIKNIGWLKAEKHVNECTQLLKDSISVLFAGYKSQTPLSNIIKCDDCILRKIAILVAANIVSFEKVPAQNIWPGFYLDLTERKLSHHGKDWHRKMLDSIAQYERRSNKQVTIEPRLNYGRADVGVRNNNKMTHIEIGTVSLFKVWYNLMTMPNTTFLLVPNEDYIIKLGN